MFGGRWILQGVSDHFNVGEQLYNDDEEDDGKDNVHDDDDIPFNENHHDDFHDDDDDILELGSSDSPSESSDFDDSEVESVDEVIQDLQKVLLETIPEEADDDNIDINILSGDIINNDVEVHQYINQETESDSDNLDDFDEEESDYDYDEDDYSYDHHDGWFDALYNDVMLGAGYDAWRDSYPEFDVDHEWDMLHIIHRNSVNGCYISLIMKVEEVLDLVGVWKNRKSQLCNQPTIEVDMDSWISASDLELNLFQVEKDLRLKLKMCSVSEINERTFQKLEEVAISIRGFLKDRVIQTIEKCLPYPLPSTVLRLIYFFLASTNGFGTFVCLASALEESDDMFRMTEMMYCKELFSAMDTVFKSLSQMLFYIYPYVKDCTRTHSKDFNIRSSIDWLECCSHYLFTHDVSRFSTSI